jgi:hypothetical protein
MEMLWRRPERERPDPAVVDEVIRLYVCWREACDDVRGAYKAWTETAHRQGGERFYGYRASLEREEHAATVYAESVALLFDEPGMVATGRLDDCRASRDERDQRERGRR